jgi:ferredoxin
MHSQDEYRPDIVPVPSRLLSLPILRQYPVPWFVAQLANGDFDFRVINHAKKSVAVGQNRCWICGQRLGKYVAFNGGPRAILGRLSTEPPSHRECAEFAARACPFMIGKEKEHRAIEAELRQQVRSDPHQETKNPGLALVWITTGFHTSVQTVDGNDYLLFAISPAKEVLWFKDGRAATRQEAIDAVDSCRQDFMDSFRGWPYSIRILKELAKFYPKEVSVAKGIMYPAAPGGILYVHFGRYSNDRIAISLIDRKAEPWFMLSVNLPERTDAGPKRFYAKTWSENEQIRDAALASGLFRDTGGRVETGFVKAEVWEILPEAGL